MRIIGHSLRHEGRYWNGYTYASGGLAPGQCECGEKSNPLLSAAARKRWHKEHKDGLK